MSDYNKAMHQYLMFGAIMAGISGHRYSFNKGKIKPKDISVVPATLPTPKGMKWFDIDGVQVQAVTKKSAIKKAKKLKENE